MILGTSLAITAALAGTITQTGGTASGLIALGAEVMLIVSFWLAITKQRLYDIDVVISRTVTYGALALFIAAVYSLVVVGVGSLINQSDEPNLWLSIGATAVIAVLFEPIHSRIRQFANGFVYGERATPYSVLSQLSMRIATADGDALGELAELAATGTGAERSSVWVRVGSRLVRSSAWPHSSIDQAVDLAGDGLGDLGAELAVPVLDGDEIVGAIGIDKQRGEIAGESDRRLLEEVAGAATLILRNRRSQRRAGGASRATPGLEASIGGRPRRRAASPRARPARWRPATGGCAQGQAWFGQDSRGAGRGK